MALISIIENFQPLNNDRLLQKAEELAPALYHEDVLPVCGMAGDGKNAGEEKAGLTEPYNIALGKGDSFFLDFGTHYVGYLSLQLSFKGSHPDAPAWIRLRFAETKGELEEDPKEYKGWVSGSWIQEEYLHVDVLPAKIQLQRRYAFRYLVITALDTSPKYKLVLDGAHCMTETSADIRWIPDALGQNDGDPVIGKIREAGLRTLANCMQDVFEDGPKRDRRLWTGDLRLTALANYAAFRNNDLVRRCLYLFAGSRFPDGRVSACVFTKPVPAADDTWLFDYSLLYVCALEEYLEEKDREGVPDMETLEDLYETAMEQIRGSLFMVGEDGVVIPAAAEGTFIDWSEEMDKTACAQAVLLYTIHYAIRLAERAKDTVTAAELRQKREQLLTVARERFWSSDRKCFLSGGQAAIATQVWMVLAGVLPQDEARSLMLRAEEFIREVPMKTPYMHHYFVEALFAAGLREEALAHIKDYWGGMVAAGADTFWEAWDPENPQASPYGGRIVNSYCHAWSCTPLYLLKKI